MDEEQFDMNAFNDDLAEEHYRPPRNLTCMQWIRHVNHTFGASTVTLLIFAYFNLGFRVMYLLTVKDLFKLYLNLEPSEAQIFSSIIALPLALKVIYGLFIDNVKLFGSSRNSYLKLWGVIMIVSLSLIQMPFMQSKYLVLMMLLIYGTATATADVVWDAIMVTSSRKDPEHGSSDLQTLHIISIWIGGVVGSALASVATEYFHPYSVFGVYIVMGWIYTLFAFWVEDYQTSQTVNVSENMKHSLNHLSKGIVYKSLLFLFISRAIVPSYTDIMYYWMIDVLNFSKTIIAILALIAFSAAIVGSVLYNKFLKNIEFRHTMIVAHIWIAFAILCIFWLVTRISKEVFHINDIFFAIFGDAAIEILFVAFIYLPTLVLQTKIVPKNVEATVYSFFTSLMQLANQFIAPMFGGIIAASFGVTKTNFESIGTIVLIQFFLALTPLTIVWILPSNEQINDFYNKIAHETFEELEISKKPGHVFKSSEVLESDGTVKFMSQKYEKFSSNNS